MEEAAEHGGGFAQVLLGNLPHSAVPATAEDQTTPRHALATDEGSLLLTDVRLLLRERPCTVGDSHHRHAVAHQAL